MDAIKTMTTAPSVFRETKDIRSKILSAVFLGQQLSRKILRSQRLRLRSLKRRKMPVDPMRQLQMKSLKEEWFFYLKKKKISRYFIRIHYVLILKFSVISLFDFITNYNFCKKVLHPFSILSIPEFRSSCREE